VLALFVSGITEGKIPLQLVFVLLLSLDDVDVSQNFGDDRYVLFGVCSVSFLPLHPWFLPCPFLRSLTFNSFDWEQMLLTGSSLGFSH